MEKHLQSLSCHLIASVENISTPSCLGEPNIIMKILHRLQTAQFYYLQVSQLVPCLFVSSFVSSCFERLKTYKYPSVIFMFYFVQHYSYTCNFHFIIGTMTIPYGFLHIFTYFFSFFKGVYVFPLKVNSYALH